jgi:hypothetical protein
MRNQRAVKLQSCGQRCFGVLTVCFGHLQRLGPYLMLELVLPGGTLFALSLYVYRHKRPQLQAILKRARLKSASTGA